MTAMGKQRSVEVAPLGAGEVADAGAVLGRAFVADPLWSALIGDPERRPEMLLRMFTGVIKTTIAARGVAEKTPGLAGVAVWLPPGRDLGLWAMVRSGFALPRFVMRLSRSDRRHMMLGLRQIGERKKALMPRPHWYVAAIGVDPELQGKGLGSVLMEHGIARADRDDAPVYLETETERNVAFYQRLGFRVIEELTLEGPAVPMWLMARRPTSARP